MIRAETFFQFKQTFSVKNADAGTPKHFPELCQFLCIVLKKKFKKSKSSPSLDALSAYQPSSLKRQEWLVAFSPPKVALHSAYYNSEAWRWQRLSCSSDIALAKSSPLWLGEYCWWGGEGRGSEKRTLFSGWISFSLTDGCCNVWAIFTELDAKISSGP